MHDEPGTTQSCSVRRRYIDLWLRMAVRKGDGSAGTRVTAQNVVTLLRMLHEATRPAEREALAAVLEALSGPTA